MTTKTTTFYLGRDIRDSRNDVLQPSTFEAFADSILQPSPDLEGLTDRLRKVRRLDKGAYQGLKTNLPYFILSRFRHNIRATHHFEEIYGFCMDIDGIDEVGNEAHETLKKKLAADPCAMAVFTTPSGAGLKVVFLLAEPCREPHQFTRFYKIFTESFAMRYGLSGKVDRKTCDVTRVHFYCADRQMFVNANPERIVLETWLKHDLFQAAPAAEIQADEKEETKSEPAIDYAAILEKLGGSKPNKPARDFFVPDALYRMEPAIHTMLEKQGISVLEVRPIQYGLKFIAMHNGFQGEVNVFAGKRGFSVVRSPRNGTQPGLNDLMHGLIARLIGEAENPANFLAAKASTATPF